MTTTMSPGANGRQQKSLAHQLDRFDRILDGLADALEGAVAASVQAAIGEAVRAAVEAALTEALRRPELRTTGTPGLAAPPGSRARWTTGLATVMRRVLAGARAAARAVDATVAAGSRRAAVVVRAAGRCVWQRRGALLAAGMAGAAVSLGVHVAGPAVVAPLCGLEAARRTFRQLSPDRPTTGMARAEHTRSERSRSAVSELA